MRPHPKKQKQQQKQVFFIIIFKDENIDFTEALLVLRFGS